MGRMSSADIKGDTARGARAISGKQAKQFNKAKTKKAGSNGRTAEVMADLGVVPEWSTIKELKQLHFGHLVEQRVQLRDEIAFRDAKVKDLDEEIQAALAVSGVEKVQWESRPVQIVHKEGSSRIVAEKLIMLGVDADTIAQATEKGKPSQYLLVGKAK